MCVDCVCDVTAYVRVCVCVFCVTVCVFLCDATPATYSLLSIYTHILCDGIYLI